MGGSIGVINDTDFTLKVKLSNGGTTYYECDDVKGVGPKQMFYRNTGKVWFTITAYPVKLGDYLKDKDGAAREADHKVVDVTPKQFQEITDISGTGEKKKVHITKTTYDKVSSAFAGKQPSNLSKAFDEIGWKVDGDTITVMCNDAKGDVVDYVKKSAMIAIQYSKMYGYEPTVYGSGGKGKWYKVEGLPTGDGKSLRKRDIVLTYVPTDKAILDYVENPDYEFTDYSYEKYYDKKKE